MLIQHSQTYLSHKLLLLLCLLLMGLTACGGGNTNSENSSSANSVVNSETPNSSSSRKSTGSIDSSSLGLSSTASSHVNLASSSPTESSLKSSVKSSIQSSVASSANSSIPADTTTYDPYNGSASTRLATYDPRYRDSRGGYVVDNFYLDGQGNVSMYGTYSGGFSFYDSSTRRDDGQMSQLSLLGVPVSASMPQVRMLVQTTYDGYQYYGWEMTKGSGDNYATLNWYIGAVAVVGKYDIPIGIYNLNARQNLVLRSVVNYPDANTAVVRAYAGTSEATLQLLDTLTVINGQGTSQDSSVPFLIGAYPGMLFHKNSTDRPMFREFTDGVTTFVP